MPVKRARGLINENLAGATECLRAAYWLSLFFNPPRLKNNNLCSHFRVKSSIKKCRHWCAPRSPPRKDFLPQKIASSFSCPRVWPICREPVCLSTCFSQQDTGNDWSRLGIKVQTFQLTVGHHLWDISTPELSTGNFPSIPSCFPHLVFQGWWWLITVWAKFHLGVCLWRIRPSTKDKVRYILFGVIWGGIMKNMHLYTLEDYEKLRKNLLWNTNRKTYLL